MRLQTTAYMYAKNSINYERRDVSTNAHPTLPKQVQNCYFEGDFACSAGWRLIEYAQFMAIINQMAYIFIP